MSLDQRLQDLIGVARKVIEKDFDETAFANWRQEAAGCLCEMFGPDHPYCKQFEASMEKQDKVNILAAGGVLEAARTQTNSGNSSNREAGDTLAPGAGV